eukprot:scaffold1201_cov247-Pinguiococcus_pyrenoidosus.AAC.1
MRGLRALYPKCVDIPVLGHHRGLEGTGTRGELPADAFYPDRSRAPMGCCNQLQQERTSHVVNQPDGSLPA